MGTGRALEWISNVCLGEDIGRQLQTIRGLLSLRDLGGETDLSF